ncbi:MAG: hypothetical protein EG825_00255 [Rhodocyclaceae bacterium]|nr:hypothetical protein [Rhodocyclaceae bacterium]
MNHAEILSLFVASKIDHREFMQHPILRGEFIYATNGHVAVRVPASNGIASTVCDDKIKDMQSLFDKARSDVFLPTFPELPEANKCAVCNGSGIVYPCPSCDGEGEFEYKWHDYECKECGGYGQVDDGDEDQKETCEYCAGSGHAQQPVKVKDFIFDRRYLSKIKDLPGVRFAVQQGFPTEGAIPPGYFVFDGGGEGLLMPMRK